MSFFQDAIDEVIESKMYDTALQMLEHHPTFELYGEYWQKVWSLKQANK